MKKYDCTAKIIPGRLVLKFILTMKLVAVFILFNSFNAIALNGVSQKSISLDLKNTSITDVLKNIELRYDYRFVYDNEVTHYRSKIDIYAKEASIDYVMMKLLQNTSFSYKKINKGLYVVIGHETDEMNMPVASRVVDEENKPLAGVSVVEKGTTNGTTTKEDGAFSINVKDPNAVLVFSRVGYLTLEVTAANITAAGIMMIPAENKLDQVVVTGYTAQRRSAITGAVAVANMAELNKQPVASVIEALQGRVTGVQVVVDGSPAASPLIRIRGYSTINSNEPLYVVDGVPVEGKLSWLNSNDIESMQVLKDASAASIYGSRANNGVIVITTKKGKKQSSVIALDGYYGMQAPIKSAFPKMMTPMETAEYVYQSYRNAGMDPAVATSVLYGGGAKPVLPDYLIAGSAVGHNVTAADADPAKYNYSRDNTTFYQITKANKEGTNWFDAITRKARMQNYQVTASGGGENSSYATSAGYLEQNGILAYTYFKRYNIRANSLIKSAKGNIRFGENAYYAFSENAGMGSNANVPGSYQGEGSMMAFAYRAQTIRPVYDIMGNFAGTRGGLVGQGQNPMAGAYRSKDNFQKSGRFFGNIYGEVDVLKGLMARSSLGVEYENYWGVDMWTPNLEASDGASTTALYENQGFNTNWTWTNTLQYQLKSDNGHSLSVLAGSEAISSRNRILTGGRLNFFLLPNPDYYYLDRGTARIINGSWGSVASLFSWFGKADYAYLDKYLVSVTMRRDGSSNFGHEYQFGNFPAAGVGWRVSKEPFMQNYTWLNDLKIRAGYGITGNQRIPPFQYLNIYEASLGASSYALGGGNNVKTGVWKNAYSNPKVRWEQLSSLNIGADITLLDNRLSLIADWYTRKTKDMLYLMPLPDHVVGGGASPYMNVGNMENKGIELGLTYRLNDPSENGINSEVFINFSRNRNKIISLAPSVTQQTYGDLRSLTTSILKPGYPFSSFYGYQVTGIYQSAEEIAKGPAYAGARVGGLRYADVNGDGVIDPKDRTIIGSPHPDFIYSFGTNSSYKRVSLSLFFNGSYGNEIYDATRIMTDFGVFGGAVSKRMLNAWSLQNKSSLIPAPTRNPSDYEYASSSYYIQNGSYLKLKNVRLDYDLRLGEKTQKRTGLNSLRLYATATNVFTITKYSGPDPEVSQVNSSFQAVGVDYGSYPNGRQFLLGFSARF